MFAKKHSRRQWKDPSTPSLPEVSKKYSGGLVWATRKDFLKQVKKNNRSQSRTLGKKTGALP